MGQDNDCASHDGAAWTWQAGAEPEGLRLERIAMPEPAAGEVLVRNEVIGLNPVDWKVIARAAASGWTPGHVPGVDGAGIVVALGHGVDRKWLGARVAYHTDLQNRIGSFARHTPVAARALLSVPEGLGMPVAASVPCPALTAWQALDKLPVRDGAEILISGAGGSVGHYLVQLAEMRGFSVTAMCNPRHWDRLRAFSRAVCMPGPLAEGAEWDQGRRFFAVIDAISPEHAAQLAPALHANGHIVAIRGRVAEWPSPAFGLALSLHEVALGALHRHGTDDDWARLTAAGDAILRDLAAGRLQPEPQVMGDFADLPAHLNALKHRSFSGKPLIRAG